MISFLPCSTAASTSPRWLLHPCCSRGSNPTNAHGTFLVSWPSSPSTCCCDSGNSTIFPCLSCTTVAYVRLVVTPYVLCFVSFLYAHTTSPRYITSTPNTC